MSRCIIGQQYENYKTSKKLNQSQVLKRFWKCDALNQNWWARMIVGNLDSNLLHQITTEFEEKLIALRNSLGKGNWTT